MHAMTPSALAWTTASDPTPPRPHPLNLSLPQRHNHRPLQTKSALLKTVGVREALFNPGVHARQL